MVGVMNYVAKGLEIFYCVKIVCYSFSFHSRYDILAMCLILSTKPRLLLRSVIVVGVELKLD